MRWIFLLVLGVALNAFSSNITAVNGKKVALDKNVQKGISGVVMCPYGGTKIICAQAVAFGNYAKLYKYDSLKNDAFALPYVLPKKGDEIIFAKDYSRIMIIAPTQEEYLKYRKKYSNAVIISPDIFADMIDEVPTRAEFVKFAKEMNIGRYIFVLDSVYEVDAISFYAVKKYGSVNAKYNKAFYTTYPDFDLKKENIVNYYKKMIKE